MVGPASSVLPGVTGAQQRESTYTVSTYTSSCASLLFLWGPVYSVVTLKS
jgi:hypothetical protein